MSDETPIEVLGIPDHASELDTVLVRSRLIHAATEFLEGTKLESVHLTVTNAPAAPRNDANPATPGPRDGDELSVASRSQQYRATEPLFHLDRLVVPAAIKEQLLDCVETLRVQNLVFDQWNLKSIEPFPHVAINLHGPAGTGKTLAAHALASYLGRGIISASYAQIESKYHGEGPKNVEALFFAAERDQAVLFLDEADSLLSRRLTDVQQGSEQAINSMRSQLLICLGKFRGIAIFATNLVENYDTAFESRIRHIRFDLPDTETRAAIWRAHLPHELPITADVVPEILGEIDGTTGRDIRNAVVNAAVRVARLGRNVVELRDLTDAIEAIKQGRPIALARDATKSDSETLSEEERAQLGREISAQLDATRQDPVESIGATA